MSTPSNVFDMTARTIRDLQNVEQHKKGRGPWANERQLKEREVLLSGLPRRIVKFQEEIADMRRADFAALSLVWGNGAGRFLNYCQSYHDVDRSGRACWAFTAKHDR